MSYTNNLPYFPPPPGQSGAPPPLPPRRVVDGQASSGASHTDGPNPQGQYGILPEQEQYGQANKYQSAQSSNIGSSYGTYAPPLPRRPIQSSNYIHHQPAPPATRVYGQPGESYGQPQRWHEHSNNNAQVLNAHAQVGPQYHPQPNNTQQAHTNLHVQPYPVPKPPLVEQQQQQRPVHGEFQHQYTADVNASYSTEQWRSAPHILDPNQQDYETATALSSPQGSGETKPSARNTRYDAAQHASQSGFMPFTQSSVFQQPEPTHLSSQGHAFPPHQQVPATSLGYVAADTTLGSQYTSHVSTVQKRMDFQNADGRDQLELQRPEVQAILRQRQIDLELYQRQNPMEIRQPLEYSRPLEIVPPTTLLETAADQYSDITKLQHGISQENTQPAVPVYNPSEFIAPSRPEANTEVAYYFLDGGRLIKGQTQQKPSADFQSQHDTVQVVGNPVSVVKPSSQDSRTSKWMNKLNDLSAGLSKLQLQLSQPQVLPTVSSDSGLSQSSSHQQTRPTTSGPVEVHQTTHQSHDQAIHIPAITHQATTTAIPLNSGPNIPHKLERQVIDSHKQQPRSDLGPEACIRTIPRMTQDGPSNSIILECPGSRALDYRATWYHLPEVPNFLVCTRCHEVYLSDNPSLASKFLAVTLSGKAEDGEAHGIRGGSNICRFDVPRLVRILIPQARATGDLAPVEEFMKHRLTLQDCPGTNVVKTTDGFKWYGVISMTTITGMQLPDIWKWVVICEACHEDRVLGTHFASKFEPLTRTQPADQDWKCDLGASSFILRSLLHYSHQATLTQTTSNQPPDATTITTEDNWLTLTTTTAPYWSLPACPGPRTAIEPSTRTWYSPNSLLSLLYCEKCYLDKIHHTAFSPSFFPLTVASKTGSAWMDFALGYTTVETPLYTCAAQDRSMLIALEYTLSIQDIAAFLDIAERILDSPVCTDQGLEDRKLNKLSGGKWYRFASGVGDGKFRICEACHACLVTAAGLEKFFEVEPADRAEGRRLVCRLHTGAARGKEFLLRYQEAVDVGVWERFEGYVRVWIGVPPCPRYRCDEGSGGLRWFGWADCLICHECWILFCKPAMEKVDVILVGGEYGGQEGKEDCKGGLNLPVRDEVLADPRMCCMYSPRMRALFLAVVDEKSRQAQDSSGSHAAPIDSPAENALLSHARYRHAVYAATIPQVRMIQQMREMQMLASLNSGIVGLMYQGAGAMQSISGNTDGYLHGSSSIGWHETENHATSAAYFDKSRAEGAAAVGGVGGDMMRVMMLMKQWETVE